MNEKRQFKCSWSLDDPNHNPFAAYTKEQIDYAFSGIIKSFNEKVDELIIESLTSQSNQPSIKP